jgi:uncharacterized membrane protein
MENVLVVVFDNERTAYEGLNYLNQLDCDGVIDIYAGSVIAKETDGRVTEKGRQGDFAFHTIAGSALGGLTGLLGGPAGFGIGATVGGLTGIIRDLHAAGVDSHFIDEVAAVLKPGKSAMVADVNEEWTTPIDTRMAELGGLLFRTVKQDFEYELRAYEITEISGQIEQLKAELAAAAADRKTKIQAQIDGLTQKLQGAETEAEHYAQQIKRETEAKVQVLQKKAATAQGEAKANINVQIGQFRKQYEDSVAKLRNVTAEKLKQAAARIQKAG